VEGHTDARADVAAALATSAGRATAIRDRLVERGIGAHRLTVVGRGGEDPIADNGTRDGRSRNRRIEIIVQRIAARPPEPGPTEAGRPQSMR
jgi:outer membrane protein OmpA-like peptidoglycan-associated protein